MVRIEEVERHCDITKPFVRLQFVRKTYLRFQWVLLPLVIMIVLLDHRVLVNVWKGIQT